MRLSTTQPCRISQATFMTSQCVSSLSCCHRFSRWLSFFRMVWIDTTHAVISPFAFFSYQVFKEPDDVLGYPIASPSISHSQWYHFLSFVHCAYIVARCSYIVKRFFLPVLSVGLPFSRESVASRVLNVRCSEFFHHAIRTCSTDSIFRIRRCSVRSLDYA